MPVRPRATFLSAIDTTFQFGPELESEREGGRLTDIRGLVGSDAINYTPVSAYSVQMDISGNKQYVRNSEQGTVFTVNLLATSTGAAAFKQFVKSQENGRVGVFKGIVSNPGHGTLTLYGCVITEWPPSNSIGDGAVGDLAYQVTATYYTDDSDITGGIGIVEAA